MSTNINHNFSASHLYDRWAAASSLLRHNLQLLTLTHAGGSAAVAEPITYSDDSSSECNTTTIVRIGADGHKTVITMAAGGGGPAAAGNGSVTTATSSADTNIRFLQDCSDWVTTGLVSLCDLCLLQKLRECFFLQFGVHNFLSNIHTS